MAPEAVPAPAPPHLPAERDLPMEADVRAAGWTYAVAALFPALSGTYAVRSAARHGIDPSVAGLFSISLGFIDLFVVASALFFLRRRAARPVALLAIVLLAFTWTWLWTDGLKSRPRGQGVAASALFAACALLLVPVRASWTRRGSVVLDPGYAEVMRREPARRPSALASRFVLIPCIVGLAAVAFALLTVFPLREV